MDLKTRLTTFERVPHRAHQLIGVQALLDHKAFGLFDEVGAGKSKQVIDAAQVLYLDHLIDTVVVVTPGFARSTWAEEDPTLGEVSKHAWNDVANLIHEFHKSYTQLVFQPGFLHWVVTNYEFIRRPDRLDTLLALLKNRRVLLVLDESWALKGFSSQMRACRLLRYRRAARVVELNGTPLADGKPTDLYYPLSILDPSILDCRSFSHFRARYCVMGGFMNKQIVNYQRLDDLNARVAPHVLSRRTRDCFDLPPMLEPIIIEAKLKPPTWALYKQMRDDMVAWLGTSASTSRQAIVKTLRLSQITSGFLGGLEDLSALEDASWLSETPPPPQALAALIHTREIGCEKLDALLEWLSCISLPTKLLVWARFRPELERATKALHALYPHVYQLKGGQTKAERHEAKLALAPGGDPTPAAVVGNQRAGGASLNYAASSLAVYLSNGPALIERTQSIGRIERPGATAPLVIVDVVAVGPQGQRTIDHHILHALRHKHDMAQWTVAQWRHHLQEY